MQFLGLYVFLALGERQPVFSLHGLAYLRTTVAFVAVRNQLCIVLHPIIKNMQVGMVRVGMPHDHILRIGNAHALHIFPCEFGHKLVREPRRILRVKRERYVPYDLFDLLSCFLLEIETADHIPYTPGIYSVAVEHTGVAAFLSQVSHGPAERLTRYDFGYHYRSRLSLSIVSE